MKLRRIISIVLSLVLTFLCFPFALCAGAVSQPFGKGTAGSEYFRIPSLTALKSGRIFASADVRYGNGTDSPANIDTGVRYSDDSGKTWSDVNLVNHFTDFEDRDSDVVVTSSASFIDSAAVEDGDGNIYLLCDACPAFMGAPYAKPFDNGYIDGKIAICDKTTETELESSKLDKEHYPYYIDEFSDGFAPIKRFTDSSSYNLYYVDKEYNLYQKSDSGFEKVMINQLDCMGNKTDKMTQANVFYACSPVKIYPAFYLWLRISSDGGETFGDPIILNTQISSKGFTAACPGKGFFTEYNGKSRIMFPIYDNNDIAERTSIIYSDDSGKTWHRSEKIKGGIFGIKSSEGQLVELNNGVLRLYSRNEADYIGYSDSSDGGETWSRYKLDPELKYCSNCMVSFINYDGLIDGKKAVIASYPTTKKRKQGVIRIGLIDDNNKIDWKYCYNVTTDTTDFTFVYSCLAQCAEEKISLFYENDKAALTYAEYSVDELKVNEKNGTFFDRIIKFFVRVFAG